MRASVEEQDGARRAGAAPPAFWYDVASGMLFLGAAESVHPLAPFIARHTLGAAVEWVGAISAAAYMGFTWNLFLGRLTARLSLRRGMLLIAVLSGLLVWVAARLTSPAAFSLVVIAALLGYGLFTVQYNTLVVHLYGQEERARLLSRRYLFTSAASILLVWLLGRMSKTVGYGPAFLLAGALMIASAAIFRKLPTVAEHAMEPFRTGDVIRAALGNSAFRRVAGVLSFYGWVGAGITPALVLLYQRCGFHEGNVGVLAAVKTCGLLLGLLVITPRMKFAGGLTNFRLSFLTALAAMLCWVTAGVVELGAWAFPVIGLGQFIFGISVAGFNLANATTGINLAPPGQPTTVYVNALMVVLGLRGMVMPMAVSVFLHWAGLVTALGVSLGVCVICSLIVLLPGIDAMPGRAQSAGGVS